MMIRAFTDQEGGEHRLAIARVVGKHRKRGCVEQRSPAVHEGGVTRELY